MLVIVDSGVANLASVNRAFSEETNSIVSNDPSVVLAATRLVLPGVGSFDSAMQTLRRRPGLVQAITESALEKETPILGICLGAQLLLDASDEGSELGLGLIPGRAKPLPLQPGVKIPHTGWNSVVPSMPSKILAGEMNWKFYFIHSFAPHPTDSSFIVATTTYGSTFPSVIGKNNIYGAQFHPEKSHRFGAAIIRNFLKL
jgi:glutamine amidotransferase